MKLSNSTMNILKNFAVINQGLVFNKDKPVYTKTVSNSMLAKCEFEDLNETFAIYNVSGYLQRISLFESPDIQFKDKFINISDGIMSIKHHYSPIDVIDYPENDQISAIEGITVDANVDFTISGEQLDKIIKASAIMNLDEMTFLSDGETIKAKLTDSTNSTADTFELDLGLCERKFEVKVYVDNMKCLSASYSISVQDTLIMFYNDTLKLTYWIAVANEE